MNLMQARTMLSNKMSERKTSSYISDWEEWYRGKVSSFHRYYVYNGKNKVYRTKASMKMAKQVCEDWASLLMNEKVKIVVSDQDKLDELLLQLDFWNKANEAVEKAFALSMSALTVIIDGIDSIETTDVGDNIKVAYIDDMTNIQIQLGLHNAKQIYPLKWVNGNCVECCFVVDNTDSKDTYCHLLNDKREYDIYHICEPKDSNNKNTEITVFHTESKIPFFTIIHPRTTNNLDIDSDLPISIFANSIDTLKAIDNKYDSYDVEFAQGKKRTYVSSKLTEVDKQTGETINTFDPEDTIIYHLPVGTPLNGEEKPLVYNVSDALRTAEHSQAIQDELNFLSKQVGLGVDYYRFEKGRVMTATQVISEKSDTFRNMKKHETVLEKCLDTIIKAIMYASNKYTENKFADENYVGISFDDSIIEDKTTEKDNDRKDVESGIMSKLQFRMKWYGETEEDAKDNLKGAFGDTELVSRINTYSQALASGGITYEEYVNQVFIDKTDAEKQTIVEQLKEQGTITADALGGYNPLPNE